MGRAVSGRASTLHATPDASSSPEWPAKLSPPLLSACSGAPPWGLPRGAHDPGEGSARRPGPQYPFSLLLQSSGDWASLVAQPAASESACNAGDPGSIPGLGRSPGEGKGYPLQYSGLENPMDYTVAKSWTRLSDFDFPFHSGGRFTPGVRSRVRG